MKLHVGLAICSQLLCATPSLAVEIQTRASDALGTTFIVSVDWDGRKVMAHLTANPARLSGDALELSLQNAVYYGSGDGCAMRKTGRKLARRNEVVGILECSWFE